MTKASIPCPLRNQKPRWILAMLGLTLISAPSVFADQRPSIRLWPQVTVDEQTVRLGDVAEILGFDEQESKRLEQLIVKEELADGRSISITGADLRAALNAGRVNLALVRVFGAARCEVERPAVVESPRVQAQPEPESVDVTEPQEDPVAVTRRGRFVDEAPKGSLEAYLRQHILARARSLDGEIKIRFNKAAHDQGYLRFTDDEYRFSIHDENENLLGMLKFEVDLYRNDHVAGTIPLVATVSLLKRVVVAGSAINLGATIDSSHLSLEVQEFHDEKDLGVEHVAALVGNQARRFIPRGRMVLPRDVKPMPLVRRNALVDVYVEGGPYRIKTSAKAMEEGSYGQTIQVKSPATGERFYVIITGPGTTKLPSRERSTMNVTHGSADAAGRAQS